MIFGFSGKDLVLLSTCMITMFFNACTYSIQGPFFPKESAKRGLTPLQYGFVFSIYELVIFLSSIPAGRVIGKLGPKIVTVTSNIVLGFSVAAFGLCHYLQTALAFAISSTIVRCLEAVAAAAVTTGIMTVAINNFPDKSSVMVSYSETFFGFGSVAAPAFTGPIYDEWGYTAPFTVVGIILIIFTLFLYLIIPETDMSSGKSVVREDMKTSDICRLGQLYPAIAGLTAAHMSLAMILSLLEPHIRFMNFTATTVGALFLLMGLGYCICSPFIGYLCYKGINPILLMICGTLLIIISFMLLAPLPILAKEPNLALIISSLLLVGFGTAGCKTPSFVHILKVKQNEMCFFSDFLIFFALFKHFRGSQ